MRPFLIQRSFAIYVVSSGGLSKAGLFSFNSAVHGPLHLVGEPRYSCTD